MLAVFKHLSVLNIKQLGKELSSFALVLNTSSTQKHTHFSKVNYLSVTKVAWPLLV